MSFEGSTLVDWAAFAQARAELLSTRWTDADERAYQALRAQAICKRTPTREVVCG